MKQFLKNFWATKIVPRVAKFVAFRNAHLNNAIDKLVNLEPIGFIAHAFIILLLPFLLAVPFAINFGITWPFWAVAGAYVAAEIGWLLWLNQMPTFQGWLNRFIAYISQEAPKFDNLPAQVIIDREANNPNFRSLDDPNYGGPVRIFGLKLFI